MSLAPKTHQIPFLFAWVAILALMGPVAAPAQLPPPPPAIRPLPPVPQPAENPITEPKRVLGKILFWEEQLSSDNTVACGTCHVPGSGGADPRVALHPGSDGVRGTDDDILGSPGVVHRDGTGLPVNDPDFGFAAQVTGRAAPSFFASLYANDTFWDGRARNVFTDPLDSSSILIGDGGALESQAVGPILSSVEMAHDGRTWEQVVGKLETARPLRFADDLPPDTRAAIAEAPSYPALFTVAFGDSSITPARIAFAIATYERTLLPDQTPWDRFIAGDASAMTASQQQGWNVFRGGGPQCANCHVPPMFTNNDFLNLGVRPAAEDEGRRAVSGLAEDFGDMKVPGLRNVGLRATLMHTGGIADITDAVDFYLQARGHAFFTADQDGIPPTGNALSTIRIAPQDRAPLIDFLRTALTDPRAATESFPFDRPRLGSEAELGAWRCADVALEDCRGPIRPDRSPLGIAGRGGIKWRLAGAEATTFEELGDPTSVDSLAVCVYDDGALVFEGRAPADGDCGDGTCWRTLGPPRSPKGYRYVSRSASPDGVRNLKMKAGSDGKTKMSVTVSGDQMGSSPFGVPALPASLPMVVQLQSSSGVCWSASYTTARSNNEQALTAR